MADSPITSMTRLGRKATSTTASPVIVDRSSGNDIRQRDFQHFANAVNRKAPSNPETPQIAPDSQYFHASKLSVASTRSASSSASSAKSPVFDLPTSTPSPGSEPTSPEDDPTPEHSQATPSNVSLRPGLQRTDDDIQLSPGSESPLRDAVKRRKASTTSRVKGRRRKPQLSSGYEWPLPDIKKSNSAPSLVQQNKPGSSRENPIILDDPTPAALGPSTLKGLGNTTISAKKTRLASIEVGEVAGKQGRRQTSASSRLREISTANRERLNTISTPDNSMDGRTDFEPSLDKILTAGPTSINTKSIKNLPPTMQPAMGTTDSDEKAEPRSPATRQSTPPGVAITAPIMPTKCPKASIPEHPAGAAGYQRQGNIPSSDSTSGEDEIAERFANESESESDALLEPEDSVGDNSSGVDTVELPDPEDALLEVIDLSEPSGQSIANNLTIDYIRRDPISIMVALLISALIWGFYSSWHEHSTAATQNLEAGSNPDDARPEWDTDSTLGDADEPHHVPPASPEVDSATELDEESPYPNFRRYRDDHLTKSDIRENLIHRMKEGVKKKPSLKKRGYIYVFTYLACNDKYFKVGSVTASDPKKRQNQYKKCVPQIIRVADEHQRIFSFVGLVEQLIQIELSEERQQFPCKTHKGERRRPTLHGEWFEIDKERLLQIIEKWRGWITESQPYNFKGDLRARWVWKLKLLEKKDCGMDLDRILQPISTHEELRFRWEWVVETCCVLHQRGVDVMNSVLFMLTFSVLSFLIYQLGAGAGSFCFVTLVTLLVYVVSGQ